MNDIDWRAHIVSDIEVLRGKPVIKGTRLSVEFLLQLFAAGWDQRQVLENYPRLNLAGICAIFAFAAEHLSAQQSVPFNADVP